MFDSQVLEVAIGLVLMFFVLALASSSIVELIARVFQTRSKQLENGIKALVDDPTIIYDTSVFGALKSGSNAGKKRKDKERNPSYVSARSFADAVVEAISTIKSGVTTVGELENQLPKTLRKRLQAITAEVGDDLTGIKARLETWFDDTMERVSGSFKRWSQTALIIIALGLAIATNASATRVAATLWNEPPVAKAVADRAQDVTSSGQAPSPPKDLNEIGKRVGSLRELGLPVGWKHWDSGAGAIGTIAGWFITALLVMLGAPFWYGLLTKLVSLRSSGGKPPGASEDPASAAKTETRLESQPGGRPPRTPATLTDTLDTKSFGDYAA